MQRSYLKLGDNLWGGTVIEGIPFFTDNGKEVTFVGATVVCPASEQAARSSPGGRDGQRNLRKARRPEGDACACKCSPPPVMLRYPTR